MSKTSQDPRLDPLGRQFLTEPPKKYGSLQTTHTLSQEEREKNARLTQILDLGSEVRGYVTSAGERSTQLVNLEKFLQNRDCNKSGSSASEAASRNKDALSQWSTFYDRVGAVDPSYERLDDLNSGQSHRPKITKDLRIDQHASFTDRETERTLRMQSSAGVTTSNRPRSKNRAIKSLRYGQEELMRVRRMTKLVELADPSMFMAVARENFAPFHEKSSSNQRKATVPAHGKAPNAQTPKIVVQDTSSQSSATADNRTPVAGSNKGFMSGLLSTPKLSNAANRLPKGLPNMSNKRSPGVANGTVDSISPQMQVKNRELSLRDEKQPITSVKDAKSLDQLSAAMKPKTYVVNGQRFILESDFSFLNSIVEDLMDVQKAIDKAESQEKVEKLNAEHQPEHQPKHQPEHQPERQPEHSASVTSSRSAANPFRTDLKDLNNSSKLELTTLKSKQIPPDPLPVLQTGQSTKSQSSLLGDTIVQSKDLESVKKSSLKHSKWAASQPGFDQAQSFWNALVAEKGKSRDGVDRLMINDSVVVKELSHGERLPGRELEVKELKKASTETKALPILSPPVKSTLVPKEAEQGSSLSALNSGTPKTTKAQGLSASRWASMLSTGDTNTLRPLFKRSILTMTDIKTSNKSHLRGESDSGESEL